jgi:hypothetical protein
MTRAILTEVFSLYVKVRLLRATRSSPYLKSCEPQSYAFTDAVLYIVILLHPKIHGRHYELAAICSPVA